MDEQEQKICPNCKREIPAVNFTIHSVHCARNIKVCPVCKEPVPLEQLQDHHDKLHKLLPCKQCGESVCGTDLEDHIRDSCGHTVKSCRFCELELPRRDLPGHESYCGVRTEQCPDCGEYVMIKYRQLHLDSNHGFLRLDDDPVPQPKKETSRINLPKPLNTRAPSPSTSVGSTTSAAVKNVNIRNDRVNNDGSLFRKINAGSSSSSTSSSQENLSRPASGSGQHNGVKAPAKVNNNDDSAKSVTNNRKNDLGQSRGAVKKRPAPRPPAREPPTSDPRRDHAFLSAMRRQQQEEQQRQEQTAYNLSVGLPPVLSPAAKLEKLRKMDALHNREAQDVDYKDRMQGRVWMPDLVEERATSQTASANLEADRRKHQQNNASRGANRRQELGNGENRGANRRIEGSNGENRGANRRNEGDRSESRDANRRIEGSNGENRGANRRGEGSNGERRRGNRRIEGYNEDRRNDFKDVKPMSTEEFIHRFKALQLRQEPREPSRERKDDRFSEIKSSLRELRRGLNEVTAPYNANNVNLNNANDYGVNMNRGDSPPASPSEEEVRLPCEFCGMGIPAYDLVRHQTGCRPDLTQYKPSPRDVASPNAFPLPPPSPYEEPVIPCEFCLESLPVYLISEHQEQCRREQTIAYSD